MKENTAMQESVQDQNPILTNGERRYQEWMSTLLSTPESRLRFEEVEKEFDLQLCLVEARLKSGLTQAELAKRLGVSRAQIVRIEQCGYQTCSLDLLQRYASAIGKKLQISLI